MCSLGCSNLGSKFQVRWFYGTLDLANQFWKLGMAPFWYSYKVHNFKLLTLAEAFITKWASNHVQEFLKTWLFYKYFLLKLSKRIQKIFDEIFLEWNHQCLRQLQYQSDPPHWNKKNQPYFLIFHFITLLHK